MTDFSQNNLITENKSDAFSKGAIFKNPNVWCYWEGNMPSYIRACIASIKYAAAQSNAEFKLLTPASLANLSIKLPAEFHKLRHAAHRSDILAARVLARYGGLFVDADIFFLESVAKLWSCNTNMQGIVFRNAQKQIAVWGMLAVKDHPVFQEWCRRQNNVLKSSPIEPEWNALGSTLLTDIVKEQPEQSLTVIDAPSTVQPVSWQHQREYFGNISDTENGSHWKRAWQPFLVLNNHMLPDNIKSATVPELRATRGPLGELLSKGRDSKRKLILGLGTGRCGTTSFARLLALNGIESTHEMSGTLKWQYDDVRQSEVSVVERLEQILARPGRCVADTAFFYLPHITTILHYCYQRAIDVRFVVLKRDKTETIDSYEGWVKEKNANHWLDGTKNSLSPDLWDQCYPSYPEMPLREAIGRYWEEYYNEANTLQEHYSDCIGVFNIDTLNTLAGLRQIEAFIDESLSKPEGIAVHENAYNTTIPVYWINLARSRDRCEKMRDRLNALQVEHHRINAIDGMDEADFQARIQFGLDSQFFKAAGFKNRKYPVSRAEYSCSASHIYAIARAFASGVPYALICEDDVTWTQDCVDRLKFILARVPNNCAILQLVTIGPPETLRFLYAEYVNKGRNVIPRQELIERLSALGDDVTAECQGTQAYIITKRGMTNVLSHFWRNDSVYFPAPENTLEGSFGGVADELLYKFSEGEHNRCWVLTQPFLLWENFGSEIHADHVPEHLRALREATTIQQRRAQLSDWPVTTYWINRDSSRERNHRMLSRLTRAGLRHVRIPAIDGDSREALLKAICFKQESSLPEEPRERPITARELACTASHYRAIYQAYSDGCELALILEDDTEPGLISRDWLNALLQEMPEDCGVLQLSVVPDISITKLAKWSSRMNRHFVKKQDLYTIRPDESGLEDITIHGASVYLIRREAMARLIATRGEQQRLCLPPEKDIGNNAAVLADRLIYRDATGGGINSYAICHPIITWETLDSELHPDHLPDHIAGKQTTLRLVLQIRGTGRPEWLRLL